MTLLSNITEKCKYERSINIINLFFLNLCGVPENLNSVREFEPLTKSIHVTQCCFHQNLIENQTLEKINAKPLI